MRVLIIDAEARERIKACIAQAKASPIPLKRVLNYSKDPSSQPNVEYRNNPSIMLPVGFGVTFTIDELPTCMARHISISVPDLGRVPSIAAVNLILEEFEFVNRIPEIYFFFEDLEDNRKAINVVEPLDGDMIKLFKVFDV